MATSQLTTIIKETLSSIPWQTTLQPTLPAQDVSVVLHEPAILAGYRVPYKPWRYYLLSIFQIHNETVNIWTHLIGMVMVFLRLYGYFCEFDVSKDNVMAILIPFGVCNSFCLLISSSVHLLHSRSPYVSFVGLMIDYMGVAVSSYSYGMASFYGIADEETYESYKHIYLLVVAMVSFLNFVIMCQAKVWYGHDPHNMNRKHMMLAGLTVQSAVNFFPVSSRYIRCFQDDDCPASSLNHINIALLVFLLQAITFAAHQPEKTWPGKFDILGHGHQIFHVFVVVNMLHVMDAISRDYKLGITAHSDPDMTLLIGVLVLLIALMIVALKCFVRHVPKILKRTIIENRGHGFEKVSDSIYDHNNECIVKTLGDI